ncbi:MAG: arsenate reductase ArsC [Candidatus Paceibacterota bacterium]
MKILFVCGGNVGRSQMAEAIFNKFTDFKYDTFSAGTTVGIFDGQKLKDRDSSVNVLKVLNEIGIDAKDNIRKNISIDLIEVSDIVISMAEKETLPEYMNNEKITNWDVQDPFDQSLEFTRDTRNKIELLVKDLIFNNDL